MTLRAFMEARGWARADSNKCVCCFHQDHSPSAFLNDNNIFCFACGRAYGLWDFRQAFGIELEKVEENGSAFLDQVKGKAGYAYNQILFRYDFKVKE